MEWIISNIHVILSAVLPGYLSVWIYKLLRNDKNIHVEGVALCVVSVSLSFFYDTLTVAIAGMVVKSLDCVQPIVIIVVECVLGLVCGYMAVKVVQSQWFAAKFNKLNHTLTVNSVFQDHFDYTKPVYASVISGNRRYRGRVVQDGNGNDDPWIVLDMVEVYDENNKAIGSYKDDLQQFHRVLLNTQTIESIDLEYTKEHRQYEKWWDAEAKRIENENRTTR